MADAQPGDACTKHFLAYLMTAYGGQWDICERQSYDNQIKLAGISGLVSPMEFRRFDAVNASQSS